MSSARSASYDQAVAAELSSAAPLSYAEMVKKHPVEQIRQVLASLPAELRIRRAAEWSTDDGLPPATARDADRVLQRLHSSNDEADMKEMSSPGFLPRSKVVTPVSLKAYGKRLRRSPAKQHAHKRRGFPCSPEARRGN